MEFSQTLVSRVAFVGLIALPACSEADIGEDISQTTSPVVSSAIRVTSNQDLNASETASLITVQGSTKKHVVAFNVSDDEYITYSETERWVWPGASHAGWAWANAGATNETFSWPARLIPPSGWPIVWGDPGLANIANTGYVYSTYVAIPQHKMPAAGYITGSLVPYLGGACVGRSTDGGSTFTLQASDCLHDAAYNGWDGSTIGASAAGKVLAAFYNFQGGDHLTTWYASSATASFVDKGDPLSGTTISGHPRVIAFGQDFFLVVPSGSNLFFVSLRWDQSTQTHSWTTPIVIASDYIDDDVSVGGVPVRRGAQFGLSGVSPAGAPSRIRIVYSAVANGHPIFKGVECVLAPSLSCSNQPAATIDGGAGIAVFHPAIATGTKFNIGAPPWTYTKVTWLQQLAAGSNQVRLMSANWGGAPRVETGAQTPCPDDRGYWGDYDVGMGVYQASSTDVPRFWRTFTDSTDANGQSSCTFQAAFTSAPVGVSARSVTGN